MAKKGYTPKQIINKRREAEILLQQGATIAMISKTIEVSEGLADVARIEPEPEIQMVRARKDVGTLPDGYTFYHYANVCFASQNVYIMYSRGYPTMGVAEKLLSKQERVLRIYPLSWFYS